MFNSKYSYPKVQNGYRWNLLKRCLYEIGIEPTCIGDMGDTTFLQFGRELLPNEKKILDSIMNNDPQNPNPSWDMVVVKDLEAVIEEVRKETGLMLMPFYIESEKGSGIYNRIAFCYQDKLTQEQRTIIKKAYHNLFVK